MISYTLGYYLQNIKHRGKRHVVKVLLNILPLKTVKGYYGAYLTPCPNDKTFLYGACGDYGRVVSDHLNEIPDGDVFIDIGTNHGVFSLMVAKNNPHSQVVSFEPNPDIYACFLKNIRCNHLKNIIPFNCAIAPDNGVMFLSWKSNHSGKGHVSKTSQDGVQIPVIDISQFLPIESVIGSKKVHIKVDVEGFEGAVIKSLAKSPWIMQVSTAVIEIDAENLNRYGTSVQNVYDQMKEIGLRPKFGIRNDHYDEIFYRQ